MGNLAVVVFLALKPGTLQQEVVSGMWWASESLTHPYLVRSIPREPVCRFIFLTCRMMQDCYSYQLRWDGGWLA